MLPKEWRRGVAIWLVKEWEGIKVRSEHQLPGEMSEQEIEAALQRLVCRNLTVQEVLAASRRSDDPLRASHLDRVGRGHLINFGQGNHHYTAEWTDDR